MTAVMLRPAHAAERFDVSRRTLDRWAEAGLIGRSKVNGVVFLSVSDIEELIASRQSRRTVLPFTTPSVRAQSSGNDDWQNSDLWRDA